ncbi:L-seryl-tRNA(Sec) selenium transferase [Xenophilus azovorans]|uniref:L-seryl-tRNA(Sec) selenium transferase n=1 Tax=Xenophilus azovorans TaxID=151755 RepID=UPI00057167B8|nr:L-seryl-tRNA(Sec) selenium transferase [Xenophilus azovorans]
MLSPPPRWRALPSLDRLLRQPAFAALADEFGRASLLETLRNLLAEYRAALVPGAPVPDEGTLAEAARERLQARMRPSLRPVFNLTGTVLHTNLGRALYPEAAIAAATAAMARPVNLEYDLGEGRRGERDVHVEAWLVRLTGAEAALVVNNNAAAVYLALNALAAGREVVVSRGELIEIGGSFRIPDIMASAGCTLREVGTTNRTHPRDYEGAIGERTAAVMKVHASNYAIQGFTCAVPPRELAALAHARGVPLVEDLGCGTLVDLEAYGVAHEPTAAEAVAAGADLVTFSGDKLLGGPQCGIVVGRREWIDRLRNHPMKRALRLDKVRLAALEAVLRLYADPQRLPQALPTLRLLTRTRDEIRMQAERLLAALPASLLQGADAAAADCASQVGSGALPVESLPSAALRLVPRAGGSLNALADSLRALPVPVLGRLHDNALLLDLRCLEPVREAEFLAQLAQVPAP